MTAAVSDLREQITGILFWDVRPDARADAVLRVVTAHVAAERERAVAEVVEPIRALLDPQPEPCICTMDRNDQPGYLLDEGWEPRWRGDTRSLHYGEGYLDCPYCDDRHGNPGWRTIEPDLDDVRAALPAQPADQAQETDR